MSEPQYDMTPHLPETHTLLWSDVILDLRDILLDLNFDAPLYIVGGAVRDAFLSRPIKDFDLATPGDAVQMARRLTDALDADLFVMSDERGVARVIYETDEVPGGTLHIDFAQFRGDDLLTDLQERDFTLNALAVDLRGDMQHIIDPLNAETDLKQKRIRRCMPHALDEDPIRMLRAIRQSVQLTMRLDSSLIAAIRQQPANLWNTSAERVRDEFMNILALNNTVKALRVMKVLGLLTPLLPELDALSSQQWNMTLVRLQKLQQLFVTLTYERTDADAANFEMGMVAIQFDRFRKDLDALLQTEWANGRPHRALLMLGTLLHSLHALPELDAAERAAHYAEQFRLSNPEKKRLRGMVKLSPRALAVPDDPLQQHRYWYGNDEMGIDALLIALAQARAEAGNQFDQDAWLTVIDQGLRLLFVYYNQYETVVAPEPLVTGTDLLDALPIDAGPIVGELLDWLREGQATGDITTREEAIAAARQFLETADQR